MRLIRVPNLFTVPGDSIAGFVVCSDGCIDSVMIGAVLISMCLYTAGIIINDCFGIEDDARERPDRPLVSGDISPAAAITVSILLLIVGLCGAALFSMQMFAIAALLTVLIIAYNRFAKEVFLLGPITMGMCRGLNVLLGAAAAGTCVVPSRGILIPVSGITLYITAVTVVSRKEGAKRKSGLEAWLPLASLMIFYPIYYMSKLDLDPVSLICAILILGFCVLAGRKAQTQAISPAVGLMICSLPLFQASMIGISCGLIFPFVIILLTPVAVFAGKKFYSS